MKYSEETIFHFGSFMIWEKMFLETFKLENISTPTRTCSFKQISKKFVIFYLKICHNNKSKRFKTRMKELLINHVSLSVIFSFCWAPKGKILCHDAYIRRFIFSKLECVINYLYNSLCFFPRITLTKFDIWSQCSFSGSEILFEPPKSRIINNNAQ